MNNIYVFAYLIIIVKRRNSAFTAMFLNKTQSFSLSSSLSKATFTRCLTNFRPVEKLHRTCCSQGAVQYFVLFTPNQLTGWISSFVSCFTICQCAERHSIKSDRDKYFTTSRTDVINRTSANRRLRAWKASHIIAICKMKFWTFQ